MRLSVPERLKLLELLPDKSSYSGMTEIYRLTMLLALTDEEAVQIEVKHGAGVIEWNQEKALALIEDIPIGEWLTNEIRGILKEKNDAQDLDIQEISLFEKFIMDYQ
jgi:hypothetical protein